MPRPRLRRRVGFQPGVTYFKPAGMRKAELEETVLTVDEFEAVRLKDLEGLDQEKAAEKMKISQPTFHRLVLAARKKIADAIVNGKAIRIEGGHYMIAKRGRGRGFGGMVGKCVCVKCGHSEPKERGIPCASIKCPACGSMMIRGD
jgi:predicted DNA-binding protein (UPF0251 family)